MIRSRLFWEIVLPYAAFALAIAAGLVWAGGSAYGKAAQVHLFHRLLTADQAIAVRLEIFKTPAEGWRDDLERLADATGMRLTVISGDGTPLADTGGDPILLGNLAELPEVRQARRSGAGQAEIAGGERLAVAVAVRDADESTDAWRQAGGPQGTLLGFVRAEMSARDANAEVTRWRRWASGLAGAAGVVGVLWAAWTGYRMSRPIETFVRTAAAITGTDPALPRPGLRRLAAPLSTALEELAVDLDAQVDRLRRENEALQVNGERLSAVLTGMAEGVLAVDRDERVLFANRAASVLLDLPDSKLVGRPLWEAVRVHAIHEAAEAALAGHDTRHVELELPRTQTVLALRASCLPGAPCPGVVLVLHDVTELRRLENLRREFVSNVSHELKTPLSSIQAYTETLLDGAIDDRENNTQFLRRIAEQTDRLHALILDLLRLARIEAGTDVFEIKKLSAGKIIEPCVEEHSAVAKSRGIVLMTEPPSRPVRLRADADGLRTILDNLLDNAINYTPTGGRVTIRWDQADGAAVIEVADTGIGIPEEHVPRIFERFHRVDKARSREHGGTGLGLAIVKHLVQVFDGRVEVESEVGRGSTFRVFLPVA